MSSWTVTWPGTSGRSINPLPPPKWIYKLDLRKLQWRFPAIKKWTRERRENKCKVTPQSLGVPCLRAYDVMNMPPQDHKRQRILDAPELKPIEKRCNHIQRGCMLVPLSPITPHASSTEVETSLEDNLSVNVRSRDLRAILTPRPSSHSQVCPKSGTAS